MSEPQAAKEKSLDPLEPWRELREVYTKAWAKSMGEYVNSAEYAQASGTMLESCLSAMSPFRDAQRSAMLSALEQLNMPSQADFVSLAQRMTNIEMLLDDMGAKLDQIHELASSAASQPTRESTTEAKPVLEAKPAVEVQPAAEAKPAVEAKPAEVKPAVEAKPAVEVKPAVEAKPAAEAKPALVTKPAAIAKPETHRKPAKTATKRSR
jgi:outer membrane biosynthesis protein TonB